MKNPINSLKNLLNKHKHGYVNQLFNGKCNITNKELCNKEVDLTKSITLGFPTSCNFKCKYCPKIDRLNDIKLDNKLLFTTLKTLEYFPNITDLKLSDNGEITLMDYNKFVDNFPKNIKSLVIFTNGSNKDWITKINNFCIEKKIALTVLVSLHTLNRDEFINITSVDYFF